MPKRCLDGSMAVNDSGLAMVIGCPIEADGKALIVGLAICFAVEAE